MNYKYIDKASGKELELPIEKWCWGVAYSDGTELKQFDDDGRYHFVGEIDQSRVVFAVLAEPSTGRRIEFPFPLGAKLVHFYKNTIIKSASETITVRSYVFGYLLDGKYTLVNVFDEGRIEVLNYRP